MLGPRLSLELTDITVSRMAATWGGTPTSQQGYNRTIPPLFMMVPLHHFRALYLELTGIFRVMQDTDSFHSAHHLESCMIYEKATVTEYPIGADMLSDLFLIMSDFD